MQIRSYRLRALFAGMLLGAPVLLSGCGEAGTDKVTDNVQEEDLGSADGFGDDPFGDGGSDEFGTGSDDMGGGFDEPGDSGSDDQE